MRINLLVQHRTSRRYHTETAVPKTAVSQNGRVPKRPCVDQSRSLLVWKGFWLLVYARPFLERPFWHVTPVDYEKRTEWCEFLGLQFVSVLPEPRTELSALRPQTTVRQLLHVIAAVLRDVRLRRVRGVRTVDVVQPIGSEETYSGRNQRWRQKQRRGNEQIARLVFAAHVCV